MANTLIYQTTPMKIRKLRTRLLMAAAIVSFRNQEP
jgi:hypothetical protein